MKEKAPRVLYAFMSMRALSAELASERIIF